MVDYRNVFEPHVMYVPGGWMVKKNHLFKISKDEYEGLDESDKFWVTENYLYATIFHASTNFYDRPVGYHVCTVDIGCHAIEGKDFEFRYDTNIWLKQGKKKSLKTLFESTEISYDSDTASKFASDYMKLFSHGGLIDRKTGRVNSKRLD